MFVTNQGWIIEGAFKQGDLIKPYISYDNLKHVYADFIDKNG